MLGCYVASTDLLVPKLSEGADSVGGQLRGDKECLFGGVTSCGRVWRKVPESDARSVLTLPASLSGTSPSDIAVICCAIEGALNSYLRRIRLPKSPPISLMLSAPFVKFAKGLSTKTVEAAQRPNTHVG